jgi:hypothetical protein
MTHIAARLTAPLLAALIPLGALAADPPAQPGKHPGYQHALTDLRAARWNIENRGGGARATAEEQDAIKQIDQVIIDVKRAAIEDNRALQEKTSGASQDKHGNLHRAYDLLKEAHSEVAREEDDPEARGLRDTAIHHLDNAMQATLKAIDAVQRGK